MAAYTLDANVVVGWLIPEAKSAPREFMMGLTLADELIASPLLLPECTTVLRREVFFGRLLHTEAVALIRQLIVLPLIEAGFATQYERALELAQQFRHKKANDMQYLAVAEMTGSILVTRDRGLRHAATQIGVPVRFLA